MNIYQHILQSVSKSKKLLAVLLDPDKVSITDVPLLIQKVKNKADFFFVGGSTVSNGDTENLVRKLKEFTKIPIAKRNNATYFGHYCRLFRLPSFK